MRDPPKVLKDKLKDRNKDKDIKQQGGHKGDGKDFDALPPDSVSHTPDSKVLCRNWNKNKCTFAKGLGAMAAFTPAQVMAILAPLAFTECMHE